MSNNQLRFSFGLAMMIALSTLACGGQSAGGTDADTESNDDDNDTAEASCTLEEICATTVDCGLDYATVEDCLVAQNQTITSCGDNWHAALACHCNCLDAETVCDDWLVCGQDCWSILCY